MPSLALKLSNALGSETVKNIAEKIGISEDEAAQDVARALPEVIDKLTPHGEIEADDQIQKGLLSLKSLFG